MQVFNISDRYVVHCFDINLIPMLLLGVYCLLCHIVDIRTLQKA